MLSESGVVDIEALRRLTRDLACIGEDEWRRCNFDEIMFPDIALRILEKLLESAPSNGSESLRNLCTSGALEDATFNFSDAQIPLFRSTKFTVDLLLWMEGTTSVHQHGFSGAFGVYVGRSLHCEYEFLKRTRVNSRFQTGELHLASLELLEQGSARKIASGQEFIHSLFHIDSPSLSLVVRTLGEPDTKPQLDYRKPFFAIDPSYFPTYIEGAAKALRVLWPDERKRIGIAVKRMHGMYAKLDTYLIFRRAVLADAPGALLDAMFEALAECDKDFAEALQIVLFKEYVGSLLVRARRTVTDPDVRAFLALVMNLDDRQSILEALSLLFETGNVSNIIRKSIHQLQKIEGMAVDESILDALIGRLLGNETKFALPSALIFHPAYGPLLN